MTASLTRGFTQKNLLACILCVAACYIAARRSAKNAWLPLCGTLACLLACILCVAACCIAARCSAKNAWLPLCGTQNCLLLQTKRCGDGVFCLFANGGVPRGTCNFLPLQAGQSDRRPSCFGTNGELPRSGNLKGTLFCGFSAGCQQKRSITSKKTPPRYIEKNLPSSKLADLRDRRRIKFFNFNLTINIYGLETTFKWLLKKFQKKKNDYNALAKNDIRQADILP